MKTSSLDELPLTQKDRLEFIDFSLEFYGRVSRQWLSQCLQLATASCTRDIALYRQIASDNLEMRHQDKAFYRTDKFTALFVHSPQKSLANLARYSMQESTYSRTNQNTSKFLLDNWLLYPNMDVTAAVNRAIISHSVVEIQYECLKASSMVTEIVPFEIFHGYCGWYVRAYDFSVSQFLDFSLSRMNSVAQSTRPISMSDIPVDTMWNTIIELAFEPHPSVINRRAIELMYGMSNGSLILEVNAVIAAHILKRENVAFCNINVLPSKRLLSLKSELLFDPTLDEL
ncbi:WYL domain-containing protein [Shewanella xiamenensis]|uniref:WYL domain-containing protein n=1 Tax=Shewanella xiamenensis TaxID=332186 RepID=UPI00111DC0DC|nr:WYL domain-containing protein [Shewanella xiamenensis]QXN25539.1 WYL domain-containing protein [Shewanella putrefaciens]